MCVHNGTHIDAPRDFIENGKAVHELDLSIFYGECTVVEINGFINQNEMICVLKNSYEHLLFKRNYKLSDSGAIALTNSHVKLIGVEGQSDDTTSQNNIHKILLKNEMILLEGLDLSNVKPGTYILSAFPINLRESDGSPVRAILLDVERVNKQNRI